MPDEQDKKKSGLKGLAQAESMIQIALAVPAGCVVGLLVGSWLDRRFHQNWIVILGMLLGAAGGFVQIFTVGLRGSKRGSKDDKQMTDDKQP
jgi:F0F1-type ATP synthase assembly protein I